MPKSLFFVIMVFLYLSQSQSLSQNTISGFVFDKNTGEALINAHVYNPRTRLGTYTNPYGFFNFKTPHADSLELLISYVGYRSIYKHIYCKKDTSVIILLEPGRNIDAITVKASKITDEYFTPAGRIKLNAKQLQKIPGLLGEKDVIKALQLMPGIEMGKEGSSGIYVRGGDRGQNLILLDGMPVYNVSHLFGFFSVFSPKIIKNVDVFKGGFPARYSGRLSSVIDIRLKEGNLYKSKMDFTIGTISSKLIYESPIKRGKSSFILAIRRTYADLLYTPLNAVKKEGIYKTTTTWSGYNFYDINLKSNYILSPKDRIYFSIYAGRDKLFFSEKEQYNQRGLSQLSIEYGQLENRSDFTNQWGNLTLSSRWNHLFNEKLFSNATISYSRYKYETAMGNKYFQESVADTLNEHTSLLNISEINDFGAAIDLDFSSLSLLKILLGGRMNWRNFVPGKLHLNYKSISKPTESYSRNFHEAIENLFEGNLYIENHLSFFDKLFVNAGLAFLVTHNIGDLFYSLQPRIMANYMLDDNLSAYASWTKMTQPLHLLVDNGSTFPVDMWVPSAKGLKPARSEQLDFGIKCGFKNMYELGAEIYVKNMKNVINYKNGESFFSLNEKWYDKITPGNGNAIGMELLISKISGMLNGWVAYSLSKSERQFNNLNNGNSFPFKYDRRHQLKFVGIYSPNQKISLTGSWMYATGMPITISATGYLGDQGYARSQLYGMVNELGFYDQSIYKPENVIYYSGINQERLPAYHRLDIGINFIKQKRKGIRTWNLSVYNVYARNNPMLIFTKTGEEGKTIYKSFSVFSLVPSVSYQFSFNEF